MGSGETGIQVPYSAEVNSLHNFEQHGQLFAYWAGGPAIPFLPSRAALFQPDSCTNRLLPGPPAQELYLDHPDLHFLYVELKTTQIGYWITIKLDYAKCVYKLTVYNIFRQNFVLSRFVDDSVFWNRLNSRRS